MLARKIHQNKPLPYIPAMPKKQHHIKLDYKHSLIDIKNIDPSPFQVRKFFDVDELKELAASILREGLIRTHSGAS